MASPIQFRIDGDEIIQTYQSEQFRAPMSSVMEKVKKLLQEEKSSIAVTPPLPKNCRFFFKLDDTEYYIIELPPGIHTFSWVDLEYNDTYLEAGSATVAMPWQYFVLSFTKSEDNSYGIESHIDKISLYWSRHRVNDFITGSLYAAKLPNIDEQGGICLGEAFPDSYGPSWKRAEEIVDNFFESEFNGDMGFRIPYGGDYMTWETETQKSMLCYMDWSYGGRSFSEWFVTPNEYNTEAARVATLTGLFSTAIQEAGHATW